MTTILGLPFNETTNIEHFLLYAEGQGGTLFKGEADPETKMLPITIHGDFLRANQIQTMRLFCVQKICVRVLIHTTQTLEQLLLHFGDAHQQNGSSSLWAFHDPRWSAESHLLQNGAGYSIDIKFLDNAIQSQILTEAFVTQMYAQLNQQ